MKRLQQNKAVSQIIGEIILLAIAVISVSIIYTQVLGTPGPQDITNVTITGKIDNGHPVFDLQRGESLERDTKIYITIAGKYNRTVYSLDQLFSQRFLNNQKWNIGERIILPTENITGYRGPQVEGTIVDTRTNTIVFWGILQEGLVTGHKGGIWHFDETYWRMNTTDEVRDSSGNNNHGIAKNNAKIINGTAEPQNVAHNNSGYFDVLNDAYIRVPSSWSLNISTTVTIEAWMKPQSLPPTLDIVDLEEKFGYTPYVVHVAEDCYAVVSEDQAKRGILQTVRIDSRGNISSLNSTSFGDAKTSIALRPIITQMTEKMYLVAYNSRIDNSNSLYVHLRVYNISTNGSIEYTGNELAFTDYNTNTPNRPSLQKIADHLCAIAYWVPSYGGILKTFTISTNGTLNVSSVKMFHYDAVSGYEPCLVNVSSHILALAYRGASNHGILKTFNVTSIGDISDTGKIIQFESGSGFEPCLIHISGKVFAIAYRNTDNDGSVKTFNISSNGSIVWTGKTMVFEDTAPCFDPCIIHGETDFYVIAYSTGNSGTTTGYVITLKIQKNGFLVRETDSRKEFKIEGRDRCYNPVVLHLNEQLFAISFTGPTDHPGELITINIELDTYPPHRGITKPDSYGIYANTSMVVGSINNIMVSSPISPGWHHFVVTYDGTAIRLFIDGSLIKTTSYPNHRINLTTSNLIFGRNYNGYIDEIVIYDQALTQTQIQNHYTHRGIFETYT
jgi:hypothetical protein